MHRSGRTARMYDSGQVITFMTINDHRKIEKLKQQGIPFKNYLMTSSGLVKAKVKTNKFAEAEKEAISKIRKPKKVEPNYKKKNKALIKKAKQALRREENDHRR